MIMLKHKPNTFLFIHLAGTEAKQKSKIIDLKVKSPTNTILITTMVT